MVFIILLLFIIKVALKMPIILKMPSRKFPYVHMSIDFKREVRQNLMLYAMFFTLSTIGNFRD